MSDIELDKPLQLSHLWLEDALQKKIFQVAPDSVICERISLTGLTLDVKYSAFFSELNL